MKCVVCRWDEATEFHGPTGQPIKRGYCRGCYERAVKSIGNGRTAGSLTKEDYETRSLSRRGTEEIGRKQRPPEVVGMQRG